MAAYSASVEKWRPLVAKYFPPELVDKALYVIQGESGGNPGAVGDGGAARGLFQIQDKRNFSSRPDAAYLDDPENNIKYAAQQLGAAQGNFGAWGEGTDYQGKPFGALGNNPYPGGKTTATSTGGTVPAPPATASAAGGSKADQAVALWQQFMAQKPTPVGPDDPGYADYTVAMDAWVKTMTQLGDIAKSLQTSEGKRDTGFDQQLSAFNAQVTATHYQNADALASAQASNTRDLGGMNVGTQRAQTALQEAELLAKWGVPKAGAQDFSYHDLLGGAGDAWANLLGTDPSASAYHVLGTGHIDTGGTAAAMDKQLGVGGPLAQIPNFLNVPEGAGMPTPPAQTTPGDNGISFNDAIGQISGSGGIPLPQGYGSTAGLGDAETPANAKPKPVTNGIFDPMATLKALFPGITLGSGMPATGATTDRPVDWTKPASAYGGNNATRFLWGDNPATAQSPNLLAGASAANNAIHPALQGLVW